MTVIDRINIADIGACPAIDVSGRRFYLASGGRFYRQLGGWQFSDGRQSYAVSVPETIAALEARAARDEVAA